MNNLSAKNEDSIEFSCFVFPDTKGVRSRSTSPNNTRGGLGRTKLDPDEYKNAKKNIKKAILEYYKSVSPLLLTFLSGLILHLCRLLGSSSY